VAGLPRVACHRDLWADNILPTPAGGVCVQELPMAMIDFGMR
jgi:Ser/Thr protein kinase RdoA (MazF antagonist)